MSKAPLYSVMLAGGSGKRLWPLSRTSLPKQLLPLSGTRTLLENSLDRMAPLVSQERQWVVTTADYAADLQKLVGYRIGKLLVEPMGRNTGPAVLLSCLELVKQDPEAVALFVPADHVIGDQELFSQTIMRAYEYAAAHGRIALIGIQPKHAATGYGYIEMGAEVAPQIFGVTHFHEKPSAEVAQWYVENGSMLWNSGIVCARVQTLLQEFAAHAPELLAQSADYSLLPSLSIDYAILEKSQAVVVVRGDFAWSDVGTLDTFIAAVHDKQPQPAPIELLGSHNNLVYAKRPVILVGVENMCVIDTGDFLCVMPRDAGARSAEVVEMLKKMGHKQYT
jgi:mannose-1-phosphate guanylyltransferase